MRDSCKNGGSISGSYFNWAWQLLESSMRKWSDRHVIFNESVTDSIYDLTTKIYGLGPDPYS